MTSAAQLFMTGFEGTTVPTVLADMLRTTQLAGVILFRRNIASVAQLRALTDQLRQIAGRPLLIAVDHEGGRVFRMPPPFTQIPPMATVGHYAVAHPERDIAYDLGRLMGQELAAVGININFAPVLDINTNPDNPIIGDRAFHADPAVVSRLGTRMIAGLLAGGVLPCGKHFPGHGDTPEDSHLRLPILPATWERLERFELQPFRAAIAAQVPLLMTAHILYGVIDADLPVTLSKRAIYTLLRQTMGYRGVVVTDDIHMGAIANGWTPEAAAVQAIAAGCDLVLCCRDPSVTQRAMTQVEAAIAARDLAAEFVEAAAERIGALFDQLGRLPAPSPPSIIGCAAHRQLVDTL